MKIALTTQRKAGIYKISCSFNNKFYIGSSKSIYYRLHRHRSDLRKNRHANQYMQNSFNKYGEDSFITEIIEECNPKDVFLREQYYIDLLKPEYNITKEVLEFKITEESKIKISNTLKKKYKSGEITRSVITKVYQYTTEGDLVKVWDAVYDAARSFEGTLDTEASKIHRACLGLIKYQTFKGFVWSKTGEFRSPVYKRNKKVT